MYVRIQTCVKKPCVPLSRFSCFCFNLLYVSLRCIQEPHKVHTMLCVSLLLFQLVVCLVVLHTHLCVAYNHCAYLVWLLKKNFDLWYEHTKHTWITHIYACLQTWEHASTFISVIHQHFRILHTLVLYHEWDTAGTRRFRCVPHTNAMICTHILRASLVEFSTKCRTMPTIFWHYTYACMHTDECKHWGPVESNFSTFDINMNMKILVNYKTQTFASVHVCVHTYICVFHTYCFLWYTYAKYLRITQMYVCLQTCADATVCVE